MRPETHAGRTAPEAPLQVGQLTGLHELSESEWEALNPSASPFLDFAFLAQLESRGLVGAARGWRPAHLIARQDDTVLAALPLYEKNDSFGEFVFDWAWAEAYQSLGLNYFPKLVCAVPFTPVPGNRILAASEADSRDALPSLLSGAKSLARERGASSLHILFPCDRQARMLGAMDMELRADCRFLWRNAGFTDFDEFLETFNSRQRKKIRSERRKVRAAGIRCEWVTGSALTHVDWAHVYGLCARTFHQRGHAPYLDADFFDALAQLMPDRLLVNLARRHGDIVACAIFFRDRSSLYGRYWGAQEQISCLHFESCYYQGIDYAIRHQLDYFDPGTQGEHKLRRGFVPVPSWSLHWFSDAQTGAAINRWLVEERRLVREYIDHCRATMPFTAPEQKPEFWP